VKRLLGGVALLGLVLVLVGAPSRAIAATPTLSGAGTVEGNLTAGQLLTVRLHVAHARGWQHIQHVDVQLQLQGSTLDGIEFLPAQSSLSILGGTAPASLGQAGQLTGPYFQVNPAKVSLSAKGSTLRLVLPIKLRIDPPTGARLTFTATAVPIASLGPKALTPPVKSNSGFSWGTLGLAIAVALFAGGFFGSVFSGRRRPAPRISVYSAVQKRLTEEKAPK
jgi:hypothetical protein